MATRARGAALAALLLGCYAVCVDGRFFVPIAPVMPKPHTQRDCPPVPLRGDMPTFTDWEAAADAATDPMTDVISFISGNRAMNALALNFGASARCLARPFPFLTVPLDREGREELETLRLLPLLRDDVAEARFAANESLDGRREFHAMARYKWEIARRLLLLSPSLSPAGSPGAPAAGSGSSGSRRDRPVLWFDPDVVLYRNPLLYMAGLPRCDVTLQSEICGLELLAGAEDEEAPQAPPPPPPYPQAQAQPGSDGTTASSGSGSAAGAGSAAEPGHAQPSVVRLARAQAARRLVGPSALLARLWPRRQVLYNTGVVQLAPSPGALWLVDKLLARFAADAAGGGSFDDQVTLVDLLDSEFFLAEAGDGAGVAARNAALRESALRGRCSTWVHRGSGRRVSVWLLSPLLFPLRPGEEMTRLHALALESPYLKHYNWMVGSAGKVQEMAAAGDWLLPPELAAVPPGRRRTYAGQLQPPAQRP